MNYWIVPIVKDKNVLNYPTVTPSYEAEEIIGTVCKFYGMDDWELCSKTRTTRLVQARQICMYLIKKHTTLSLKTIAHRLGGRDHTTAIHSIQHLKGLIDVDDPIVQDITAIVQLLKFNAE